MRSSHIENRLEQQLTISELIANAHDNLTKVGASQITLLRIRTRISDLKSNWEKFSISHEAITMAVSELILSEKIKILTHAYFIENLFSATHECYLETLEKMNSLLTSDQSALTRSISTESFPNSGNFPTYFHNSRLPRINIPKFDGSPAEWLSFKDLFISIVLSNPTLTSVEKFQYLKTSLIGSAAQLIKNTSLTADNFQKTWEALISFYENKRLLVNAALHALINLKRMTKESAAEMEQLYTSTMQIYRTLETLNRPVKEWDDFLVFIIVQRLDSESVKAWEQHLGSSKEPPTWDQLRDFLITRLLSLRAFEKSRIGKTATSDHPRTAKTHFQGKSKDNTSSNKLSCSICSSKHYVSSCPQYINKTEPQRLALIVKYKLCYNCLGPHRSSSCRITKRCLKCGRKHHTTIHQTNKENKENSKPEEKASSETSRKEPQVLHVAKQNEIKTSYVLLATAQVTLISPNGESEKVRVLIDQGSEVSLITERITQRFRLPRLRSSLSLFGIGAQKSRSTRGITTFKLRSRYDSDSEITVSAYILPRLTSAIPSVTLKNKSWPHLTGLSLADPDFFSSNSIDVILGADVYYQVIKDGIIKGTSTSPMAQSTVFGWILSGPTGMDTSPEAVHGYHISADRELYDLLSRFWELEEVPVKKSTELSLEEQRCEEHFKNTYTRDSSGQYVLRLPFKDSPENLGDSRNKALRLVTNLSNRFVSNPIYAQAYSQFIQEYEDLHHMRRVQESNSENHLSYYLPHHGVLREHSLTTKLRVVFNGSSRSTSGVSLNDILHTGEKLQTELFNVLLWFRMFRYVFSSDIEKMFRKIKIHQDDWKFLRILWIDSNNELIVFELTTVTYGLVCAPFQSLRTLLQLIEDEGSRFPLAVPTALKGRYMDDFFGGADTIEEAKEIASQTRQLCMAGGFKLQKWISNHPNVLTLIPQDDKIDSASIQIEDSVQVHTLGLSWKPTPDSFQFTWKPPDVKVITKRKILSTIASLFDPLGFLSPVTIQTKILIQELWTLKLGWDDSLPSHLSEKWENLLVQLEDLSNLTFPRWMSILSNSKIEIHGFCDASIKAMAAVVYIRTVDSNGIILTNLIASKSKVAPLKRQTIPRLELAGAVLITRLVNQIINNLQHKEISIFLWTDSAITLTWINNQPSRWKDFVHNRVCFIQESLPQANWGFVSGKENPADLATRGLTPARLQECNTWWTGPEWLSQDSTFWPTESPIFSSKEDIEEKPSRVNTVVAQRKEVWNLLQKYSSLTRLIRITAWCKRAASIWKGKRNVPVSLPLAVSELEDAKLFWIRSVQEIYFHNEIKIIGRGQSLQKSNPLIRLTPYLDSNGLLLVGGRLRFADLSEDSKHPLILPKDSTLTSLIIADAHDKTLHGGTQTTLSYIRENYWIIGGRVPVKSFILKCVKCARYRQQRAQQIMGQLPVARVTPSRPFFNTGIDYAGPFVIKTWKGRNAKTYKAYIALFVCLATSAIHLELVTDYTTEAFIAAYKRFTSRRGICATLTSDCGTNLVGADIQLKKLFSSSSKELGILASVIADNGTQWNFNPPHAPHFGGKWEAGVKSVKTHLKRVVGDTFLTYEEMSTLITQIEAVLNSRPMSPLSEDPEDLSALTPGHFLMGCAPSVVPEPSLESIKTSHLSRWQLIRNMLDKFWTRWSSECLQRYLAIYKWNKVSPPIKEGSLVLVVDERYPPSKWPLGRVIQTHSGEDGHIRVVTVRTQTSTFKRPIVKLCPLPIPNETM